MESREIINKILNVKYHTQGPLKDNLVVYAPEEIFEQLEKDGLDQRVKTNFGFPWRVCGLPGELTGRYWYEDIIIGTPIQRIK